MSGKIRAVYEALVAPTLPTFLCFLCFFAPLLPLLSLILYGMAESLSLVSDVQEQRKHKQALKLIAPLLEKKPDNAQLRILKSLALVSPRCPTINMCSWCSSLPPPCAQVQ